MISALDGCVRRCRAEDKFSIRDFFVFLQENSSSSILAKEFGKCNIPGRNGDAELARFCLIARGSASELEYHVLSVRDLKLIKADDYEKLAQQTTEIKRMLTVFVQKLKAES